jgi:hypothetical protein
MAKSRPYIVTLDIPNPNGTPDLPTIMETRLINATSQSAAEKHAIKRHIPGVIRCGIADNVAVMRAMAAGIRLEDTTGDPDLAEKPMDVTGLIGGGE